MVPTREAVATLCTALRKPEELGEGAALLLRRLYSWLWSGCAGQVQGYLEELRACPMLVSTLSCKSPAGRAAAYWACHVIGRAVCGHSGNAMALMAAGAIKGICALVERHPHDSEVHLAGATALGYLSQVDAVRRRLAASGTVGRLIRAVETNLAEEEGW